MIKVLVADKNFLSRTGLELLVGELKGFELVPTVCGDKEDLENQLKLSKPNLILSDFLSLGVTAAELKALVRKYNRIKFVVVTELLSKPGLTEVLSCGVSAYLLKECEKAEILEAINATIKGEKFICGKIVSLLSASPEIVPNQSFIK